MIEIGAMAEGTRLVAIPESRFKEQNDRYISGFYFTSNPQESITSGEVADFLWARLTVGR